MSPNRSTSSSKSCLDLAGNDGGGGSLSRPARSSRGLGDLRGRVQRPPIRGLAAVRPGGLNAALRKSCISVFGDFGVKFQLRTKEVLREPKTSKILKQIAYRLIF